MDKIEEVKKKLLDEYGDDSDFDKEGGFYPKESHSEEVAIQICQLFPKTKENPDGYELKPDEIE